MEQTLDNDKNWQLDEERGVIIYNPHKKYLGDNISKIVTNMLAIAKLKEMPVETVFNDITFQVDTKMSVDDGVSLWKSLYKSSPQRNIEENNLKLFQTKCELQKRTDEKLIANETYEIPGYERHFDELKQEWLNESKRPGSLLSGLGQSMINYAETFGKLLQAEMKRQDLSADLVKSVCIRAGEFGLKYSNYFNMIGWKHSDKLQEFEEYKSPDFDLLRVTWHNKSYDIYDKYKAKINQTDNKHKPEEMANLLAEVFGSHKDQLEHFYKKFSNPEEFTSYSKSTIDSICPAFKSIDDLKWTDFAFACTKACDIISEKENFQSDRMEKESDCR